MASNDRHNPASLSDGYQNTYFDDSFNDEQVVVRDNGNDNSTTDLKVDDSGNTDTDVDVDAKDFLNDKSVSDSNNDNSVDVDAKDFLNDKSVDDSNNDNSTNVDLDAKDFLNDKSVSDSNNDNSQDNSTDDSVNVDVGITDSFKDSSSDDSVNDSYNDSSSHTDLDVGITDSFKDSGLVDIGDIGGYLQGILGVEGDALYNPGQIALQGDGNIFDIDQALTLTDNDMLSNATVSNEACFDMSAHDFQGGTSSADHGGVSGVGEGDVTAGASSAANALAQLDAFNQTITMGANIQYASVDMDVIGGSDHASLYGDDA